MIAHATWIKAAWGLGFRGLGSPGVLLNPQFVGPNSLLNFGVMQANYGGTLSGQPLREAGTGTHDKPWTPKGPTYETRALEKWALVATL